MLLIAAVTVGCAGKEQTPPAQQSLPAESAASFSVPAYLPRATVDQTGYGTGSEKTVFFSEEAGDSFEVRSIADDATVFTGSIVESGDVRYGQFTAFQTPGAYYIYTREHGSSYAFTIGGEAEGRMANALLPFYFSRCGVALDASVAGSAAHGICHTQNARLQQDPSVEADVRGGWHTDREGARDTVTTCRALRDLMLSFEINGDRYTDSTAAPESGNGIPDVLDEARWAIEWLTAMQTAQMDVCGAVLTGGNENSANLTLSAPSAEATIAFAGAAARFSYLYAQFDPAYAQDILSRAQGAWNAYAATGAPRQDAAAFSAAAELYRVTGDRKYETVLSTFFQRDDFASLLTESEEVFYGSVTYLVSDQPVNVAVRRDIRQTLLEEAERIAEDSASRPFFVASADVDELLFDMCVLAVANYLEYQSGNVTVMEHHLHYLYGCNEDTVNHVSDRTEYTYKQAGGEGIASSLRQSARLALLLYAIG